MSYSKKELKAILKLALDKKLSAEEAIERYFENKQVLKLHNRVKEYFNLETLEPKNKETKNISPMVVFLYLYADLIKKPNTAESYKPAIRLVNKDRTTIYHYIKDFSDGKHKYDQRMFQGDTIYNHYLKIKGDIKGEDYSNLMHHVATPEDKKIYFLEVFDKKEKEIISLIEEGCSHKILNDIFFKYEYTSSLKRNFKTYKPDLDKKIINGNLLRGKLINIYFRNKNEIDRRIKAGATFELLNSLYFDYYSDCDLKREMRIKKPNLYKKVLKNEELYEV